MDFKDEIIKFYSSREENKKLPLQQIYTHITNLNPGLGDTISLTHLPFVAHQQSKKVFINSLSPHFGPLMKFNEFYEPNDNQFIRAEILQGNYNCGNGHFFQRLQRACGLKPELIPKGYINCILPKIKNRIILHLSVGAHAINQKHIHPRAREFYPEHRETLQKFILNNENKYRFIEVGTTFSNLNGVENKTGLQLEDTIKEIAQSEYFIGLHSGPMHLATALNLKSIVIINFPFPLILPALKDLPIPDWDWLYSQNMHLNQDEGNNFTPIFSLENLEKSLNGEIYPFWSNKYLDLIYEKI